MNSMFKIFRTWTVSTLASISLLCSIYAQSEIENSQEVPAPAVTPEPGILTETILGPTGEALTLPLVAPGIVDLNPLKPKIENPEVFLPVEPVPGPTPIISDPPIVPIPGPKSPIVLPPWFPKPVEGIKPSFQFKKARHVVNGVTLRNRTSGTIHLRGVPAKSEIVAAILYWNFLDDLDIGADTDPVLFNGNKVIGRKTADSADPCWSNVVGSHSYVANVTQYVTDENPNQDYQVVLFFDEATSTTGQNPWEPSEAQDVRTEGASLIVVYRNDNFPSLGPVNIYDDLSNSMFFTDTTFNLSHQALNGSALFSMIGADGQRGAGHDNFAANELTFFNNVQIAGSPIVSADWDGSDGWPLPQLWDTHTHIVKVAGIQSNVRYQVGGDCLVPVAFVIDVD